MRTPVLLTARAGAGAATDNGAAIADAITIEAPRTEVFAALTQAERLERWLATEVESEPRTGGRFRYSFEFDDPSQNRTQEGEYVDVVAGERVVLPWLFHFSSRLTRVEYVLTGDDETTRVDFRHSGFHSGEPWDGVLEDFAGGWRMFLERLRAHVEKGEDGRPFGIRGKPT
jgi:uncharacterized protein YndB with AHSA1/START domain